jgi:2-methylcitrate dehydratase PrpD
VFGGMGKPLNAGAAAAGGVEAVDLVAAGLRCDPAGPERHGGLGPLMAGEGRREALRALGGRWEMTGVTHKFHACCHGLHAALEALSQVDIASAALDRVTIRTHPRWLSVCDKRAPRTGLEAKFSYRFTAAMALAGRDTAAIDSYSDAACAEPELVALRDRVDVVGDPTLAETAAVVDVTAHGGRAHRVAHDLAAPMAQERRGEKLRAKATSLLGEEAAAALDDAVLSRPTPDLGALLDLLRRAPG